MQVLGLWFYMVSLKACLFCFLVIHSVLRSCGIDWFRGHSEMRVVVGFDLGIGQNWNLYICKTKGLG